MQKQLKPSPSALREKFLGPRVRSWDNEVGDIVFGAWPLVKGRAQVQIFIEMCSPTMDVSL